jgi:hypothetical protein
VQGQASDILIQAKEIERLKDQLISLYVKHCGQDEKTVRKNCYTLGTSNRTAADPAPLEADDALLLLQQCHF